MTATSDAAPPVIHCNACSRDTQHEVLYEHKRPWEASFGDFEVCGSDDYRLLSCRGCRNITLQQRSWMSEDTDADGRPFVNSLYYPPRMHRRAPTWIDDHEIPQQVTSMVREIYTALESGAVRLATMGVRALLEHVMVTAVKDHGSFARNLAKFEEQGYVSPRQKKMLESTLEVGHAAMHRGYTPLAAAVGVCLDVAEHLIASMHVLPDASGKLKTQLPGRKKKARKGKQLPV